MGWSPNPPPNSYFHGENLNWPWFTTRFSGSLCSGEKSLPLCHYIPLNHVKFQMHPNYWWIPIIPSKPPFSKRFPIGNIWFPEGVHKEKNGPPNSRPSIPSLRPRFQVLLDILRLTGCLGKQIARLFWDPNSAISNRKTHKRFGTWFSALQKMAMSKC